jgi:uncharacterized tellurite resistance protein B-like protein
MLNSILDFLDKQLTPRDDPQHQRRQIEVATAALLVEVVRVGRGIADAQRNAVLRAVAERFGLTPAEAADLVRLAERESNQAHDYFQFTSLINKSFTQQQKLRVIELMWQVAYADARLSAQEQHVMRKVAELLYVPHADYIAAKLRASEAAGQPRPD